MPALKSYGDFYDGSAAKKLDKKENLKSSKKQKIKLDPSRRYGKNKLKQNSRARINKNLKVFAMIFCGFTMTMLITYRYNVISEKNLKVQDLKGQLSAVEANLLTKQIEVEQNTDFGRIESYAKQQLGMQKPDKNQTIYIDTSKTMNTIEINKENTKLDIFVERLKEIINKIFSNKE